MRLIGALAVTATLILTGCTAAAAPGSGSGSSGPTIFPDSRVQPLIDDLGGQSTGKPVAARLADGLIPPTNRWFSGLVFGDAPLPVFPLPLSFQIDSAGFSFGVPEVVTTPNTITAGSAPSVTVDAGAASSEISPYDEASVTVDLLDDAGDTLGAVTIAEGSPLVTFVAENDIELRLGSEFTASDVRGPGDSALWTSEIAGKDYALSTEGSVDRNNLSLKGGDEATWLAVPEDGDLSVLAASLAPVEDTSVAYSVDGATAATTISYRRAGMTLLAAMPHQQSGDEESIGTYESAYGTMTLVAANSLSWTSPTIEPSGSVDVSALSGADRDTLAAQVAVDAKAEPELPADTYFGGKALYRLAGILDLAEQLGDTESAAIVSGRLGDALREWTEPGGCSDRSERCFVYDEENRGIVGLAASFGSEEFNDHHFHYGYFFYAASVAAAYDETIVADLEPVMTLLAADLATAGESTLFPERRVFDAYAGHSWASGYSPFADGNNQESSSEAVLAWNGLALWAAAVGDADLETEATWMLASEAATANAYWTNFDQTAAVYDGYDHSIVSLNWGGKRDYATWFSPEPAAKLAIVSLPMSPVSDYLGTDPERVDTNVAAATPGGFAVTYGDWLLMYAALGSADSAALIAEAETMPDELIDGGNSRSALLAWILTH